MRILLCTVPYPPAVGGLETVSALLAAGLQALGHDVRVVTRTRADVPDRDPFPILRDPAPRSLARAMRWCEVLLHNNISLRFAWPKLVAPSKPWVIVHHMWTPRTGPGALAGLAKRSAMRFALNAAVSRAMARSLPVDAAIVPNPYDDATFVRDEAILRDRELVFVGRLEAGKGVAVLLDALALLAARGLRPRLTIVGKGPAEPEIARQVAALGLGPQVERTGVLRGAALAACLNRHRLLVVPSLWEEPFGVVALEGLACGLVPVVAASGGLPEAVGPAGVVVARGDAVALAVALQRLLENAGARDELLLRAPAHLAAHSRASSARAHAQLLDRACRGRDAAARGG